MPRSLALVLLLVLPVAGDTVWVKGGRKIEGRVVSEEPEVVINEFNSPVEGVVLGTHRFPPDRVKKIERDLPAPHHEFQRRLQELLRPAPRSAWGEEAPAPDGDAAASLLALAAFAEEHKLKDERLWAMELALRHDPENAEARKALGSKAPKTVWADQVGLARRYLEAADGDARDEVVGDIRRDAAFPFDETYLQRAARSARQAKGYQKDRALAMRADRIAENARYTLLVPDGYDPLEPTPLVIGLHGGGPGGADGKLVVGDGWQAMSFYQPHCEARGWICACPTAVQAGWRGPNDDLIDALLEEMCALYNIDENRVYLVGHSMGGGGTWAQGTRIPETWAAIAPAASFGVTGLNKLEKTKTGFYVYHSDDDPRTRVEGVRPAMENLPGKGIDFVYTELPGQGHGFPQEVIADIFRYFDERTLSRGPGRPKPQVRPQSSFLRKVSRDEKRYLPSLEPDEDEGDPSLKALLDALKTGGGVAEQAVDKLVAHPDPGTAGKVARILVKGTTGPDVRRYCARILGRRKAADQLKALGRVLLVEEEANALLEILDAVGEIQDAAAADDLVRFLRKRVEYFERRTQGSQMHHKDWETILPTLARACGLLGSLGDPKGAPQVARTLEQVFLGGVGVVYDRQNQNPRPAAWALADAGCGALAKLKGPEAQATLERLAKAATGLPDVDVAVIQGYVAEMTAWPREPRIRATIEQALNELSG